MQASVGSDVDPVIGRAGELAAIVASLAGSRLVTLTGLGGIGKTTLASEVAAGWRPDHPAAAFVDLSAITDPQEVSVAIAASLGLTGTNRHGALPAVIDALARRPRLLVLDNFEHLLPARDIVRELHDRTDPTRILVTSRAALGLAGERTFPLEPLALPDGAADVETAGASRLFLRRARERGRLGTLDPADLEAVAGICRRLDGVPLAIELAAAWSRVLSPRAILRRLDEQRLPLADDDRGRQATMDRVLASTLDLLAPADRDAFEQLALFVVGFDERDARALVGIDNVLPLLRRLEAFALVRADVEADGEPRFRMLETIRATAATRFDARTDAPAIRRRFVEQSAAHAQEAADALRDVEPEGALAWMTREAPNLRVALELATSLPEPALAVQLAMTLATHGVRAGNAFESLRRLRAAMALGPVPPGIRSEALCAIINLCWMTGDPVDVGALGGEAVALARQAGDPRREARALVALGSFGPPEVAVETLTAAIDVATRIGYQWALNAAMDNLATVHADAGRWKAALELLERSAEAARRCGDTGGLGYTLAAMADLDAKLGRREAALTLAAEAARLNQETWPNSDVLAGTLATLATCQMLNGLETASVATLVEAADMVERAGTRRSAADVLEAAVVVLARRKPAIATRAAGGVAAFDRTGERPRSPSPVTLDALAELERALGPRRFADERSAGSATGIDELLIEVRTVAEAARRREERLRVEFGSLTSREVDVLGLLARGRSDVEIGKELGMSAKTASVHVGNIKGKLGVQTRVEAAMRAQALLASPSS